jgi:glycosyltransferase involved in cell wall biosynthesis
MLRSPSSVDSFAQRQRQTSQPDDTLPPTRQTADPGQAGDGERMEKQMDGDGSRNVSVSGRRDDAIVNRAVEPISVICAFYASNTYGSEYRAGLEFIQFAAANGFTLAIVADLQENSSAEILEMNAPGIRVIRIPSLIKRQSSLYRYHDILPQWLWHHRVARWLRAEKLLVQSLWIQNGASPWLPISPYFGLSKHLIWGPVGGGEPPTPAMMKTLPWRQQMRERLRSGLERILLNRKQAAMLNKHAPRLVTMARTRIAQRQLSLTFGRTVPVIPEIINPLNKVEIHRGPASSPRFIWVGQDIPRKNLPLAFKIFRHMRETAFPQATLDIFGCQESAAPLPDGAKCHGWVRGVPWDTYRNDGVLLLTSFREGLPSVILEAASNGLLCIASDVGPLGDLNVRTIHMLPHTEYPEFTRKTLDDVTRRVLDHLAETKICLPAVSNKDKLSSHLRREGAIA